MHMLAFGAPMDSSAGFRDRNIHVSPDGPWLSSRITDQWRAYLPPQQGPIKTRPYEQSSRITGQHRATIKARPAYPYHPRPYELSLLGSPPGIRYSVRSS